MKHGPHILVCGETGTGKSTFAATVIQERNPRPVLVQLFDPHDKGTPYRRRGDRIVLEEFPFGVREKILKGDKHVATLETWHEQEGKSSRGVTMQGGVRVNVPFVKQGEMFEGYLERMESFKTEAAEWYAFIGDSATFFSYMVRSYLSGVMRVQDNQMVWAQATDELERYYLAMFPDLPITTIVISHVVTEKQKGKGDKACTEDVYELAMPGRLGRNMALASAYGENYRSFISLDDKKNPVFAFQTRSDGHWKCSSQLEVPDPFVNPHWKTVYDVAMKVRPEGVEE